MKIGVAFNLRKVAEPGSHPSPTDGNPLGLPLDDEQEEFDSPQTIAALAEAIESFGHEVELLGDGESLLERLLDGPRLDLVWNTAEGTGRERSREARVPAVLEMLRIPHTGSDPLTLAATLDKDCAKRLVASYGVATPKWLLIDGGQTNVAARLRESDLRFPAFAKPACEGSSKGIVSSSIIHDLDQLQEAVAELREVYRQNILVEEFIDGDELTVGLTGNDPPEVLGIMRIMPRSAAGPFVYGLEVKRDFERLAAYECPARLARRETQAVMQAALASWQALGCRDVARIDFRLRDGVPYFLEANPLPGLSPQSGDLVILSKLAGIAYRDLVGRILSAAIARLGISESARPAAQMHPELQCKRR
jgi:D-alanine-D-alanine ligase